MSTKTATKGATKGKAKSTAPKPKTPKKGRGTPKREQKKIAELEKRIAELEDKNLRLKAEFDNYRKRKEREIIQLLKYEGETVIKDILTIIDDLERMVEALESNGSKQSDSFRQGIMLIINKSNKLLLERGVEPFGEVGTQLDSELHDALMVRTEDGKEDNEILEVFQKGYRYKDRIIRHAKVIVNKK